jgi:hypothetical protein
MFCFDYRLQWECLLELSVHVLTSTGCAYLDSTSLLILALRSACLDWPWASMYWLAVVTCSERVVIGSYSLPRASFKAMLQFNSNQNQRAGKPELVEKHVTIRKCVSYIWPSRNLNMVCRSPQHRFHYISSRILDIVAEVTSIECIIWVPLIYTLLTGVSSIDSIISAPVL